MPKLSSTARRGRWCRFFRIAIEKITGHRASSDTEQETSLQTVVTAG